MSCPVASDGAMVCAECFLAKGGSRPRETCSNPRCYFYRRGSGKQQIAPVTDESDCLPTPTTIPRSTNRATAFVKEIGHERTRRGSALGLLESAPGVAQWGHRPESVSGKAFRRRVTFSDVGGGGGEVQSKGRSQSISEACRSGAGRQGIIGTGDEAAAAARAKAMRARMMSMPLTCVEPYAFGEHDCDLVEDAFLSSPLPDLGGGEEVRMPRVPAHGIYKIIYGERTHVP